jgi:hypothetical protein
MPKYHPINSQEYPCQFLGTALHEARLDTDYFRDLKSLVRQLADVPVQVRSSVRGTS